MATPAASPTAEPRWPALLAVVAIGSLLGALPESLSFGPRWLVLAMVGAFSIPLIVTHRTGRHSLNQQVAYGLLGVITLAMVGAVLLLVRALPSHREPAADLLRSAAMLWGANILLFASWYWRLDAGGPHLRSKRITHADGAFLFPQMTLEPEVSKRLGQERWSPHFMDYLFLAFNTSTAFSPTDVPALSRWAKAMMMVQSLISLSVIVILAARAINTL